MKPLLVSRQMLSKAILESRRLQKPRSTGNSTNEPPIPTELLEMAELVARLAVQEVFQKASDEALAEVERSSRNPGLAQIAGFVLRWRRFAK